MWKVGSRFFWLVGLSALALLLASSNAYSWGSSKGPYATEIRQLKANLKAFPEVKKIALVGVIEVLEDLRSGKQDFIYRKIPSQKLALRFSYLMPEGFTVLSRSAADIEQMLKEQGLQVGDLLNVSQVSSLGKTFGADALLIGVYYSSTKNGYDVDIGSSVFIKLMDVKSSALVWTRELDKKDLQVPNQYTKVSAPQLGR